MDKPVIIAASMVTDADLPAARLGPRFGRLDLSSQLVLLAVESLGVDFNRWSRERVAICLTAQAGSLATDVAYWNGRESPGGPSPTLFAYTLPSAAIGEIAIRHRLTGPNLCFVGDSRNLIAEAADLLYREEAEACVCVAGNVVTPATASLIGMPASARARALFLAKNGPGLGVLGEIDRDMESLCAVYSSRKSAS